jgi:hypothetical protein
MENGAASGDCLRRGAPRKRRGSVVDSSAEAPDTPARLVFLKGEPKLRGMSRR